MNFQQNSSENTRFNNTLTELIKFEKKLYLILN